MPTGCCARWCRSPTPGGVGPAWSTSTSRGTFYPFAPTGPQKRDNLLEIQVRDALAGELPIEQELQRWLAVWGAPGL